MNTDPLLKDAKKLILKKKCVSVSALQRHFQIGFMRGSRIIEQLEREGFVSKPNGNLKREILRDK